MELPDSRGCRVQAVFDCQTRKDQREERVLRLHALAEEGLASGSAASDTKADRDELTAIARGDSD